MNKVLTNENKLFSLRAVLISLVLVLSSLLIACGGSDNEGKVKVTTANTAKQNSSTTLKKPVRLDTTPIAIEKVLNGVIEYTKIPECPFLTDETASSTTTKGGDFGSLLKKVKSFERRFVSNKKCVWSNMDVFFQPAKTAKTLQKRAKKRPETIKLRKGPGTDAAILYKKSSKNKLIPYSIGFTQGDHYILLSTDTYSFVSSEKQLQAAADEIAKRLPNASKIEEQQKVQVKPVDFCKIWEIESLKSLYKFGDDKGSIGLTGNRGGCNFAIYPGNRDKITLDIGVYNKGSVAACQKTVAKNGYTQLNDYGEKMVVYKRDETDIYLSETYKYCFDQGEVYMTTNINYDSFPDKEKERMRNQYKTQLKPLFENFLKRVMLK